MAEPITNVLHQEIQRNLSAFAAAPGNGEVKRSRRYRSELSVVLFDIDRFKSVNDRFGHPEGNRMLAEAPSQLKSSLRQSDAVFRYGGAEFAALCPET